MITLLVILGVVVVGLIVGFVAAATAPLGYQDETGFHYGDGTGREEEIAEHRLPKPEFA